MGVSLSTSKSAANTHIFSHASGSVPVESVKGDIIIVFFPRKWECSSVMKNSTVCFKLFSTQVRMCLIIEICLLLHFTFLTQVGEIQQRNLCNYSNLFTSIVKRMITELFSQMKMIENVV